MNINADSEAKHIDQLPDDVKLVNANQWKFNFNKKLEKEIQILK